MAPTEMQKPDENKDQSKNKTESSKDAENKEKQAAIEKTQEEMKALKLDIFASLKASLVKKLGENDPRVESVMNKIEKLGRPSMSMRIRGAFESVKSALSFLGIDFGNKVTGQSDGMEGIATQVSAVESKVDEITNQISAITSGENQQTGEGSIDQGLQSLITQANALKQTQGMTTEEYKKSFTKLLEGFIISLGGTVPSSGSESSTNNANEKAPDGLRKAEVNELIEKYPPDMKNYCLKEVRLFMQRLHKNGLVQLPVNLDNETWGAQAKDFGSELKHYQDNLPKEWNIEDFSKKKDDSQKDAETIAGMKGDIFNIIFRKGNEPGHICVAFRQDKEIIVYDNSFARGADKGGNRFSLQNYLKLRTEEGSYKLDTAVALPLDPQKLVAYTKRTTNAASDTTA